MDGMRKKPGVAIRDVAPGLWLWRQAHWEWEEGTDWEPEVASFVVHSGGHTVLLDPLAPSPGTPDGRAVYDRLNADRPTAVVVIKPDHVRDVDLFAHWYGIPAFGPWLFERGAAPVTELTPVRPGDPLPGGLLALSDGRGGAETPVYLPEQRAIAFADGMTAPGGVLRVWWSPSLEKWGYAALRTMLDLPFEVVLVSHGEPVHSRADFEAALEREPWSRPED